MRHLSGIWKNEFVRACAGIAAGIVAAVAVSVTPAYRNYVRADNIDTCYDSMYSLGLWYHLAIQDEEKKGVPEDQIDYEGIVRDLVRRHFGVELDEDLSSDEICRAGGVWKIHIDPDTHKIMVQCTADGHIWYVDSVDEHMLNEFRSMEY